MLKILKFISETGKCQQQKHTQQVSSQKKGSDHFSGKKKKKQQPYAQTSYQHGEPLQLPWDSADEN